MKDFKISSIFLELCLLSVGEAVVRHSHVVAQGFLECLLSRRCETGVAFAAVTTGYVV